MKILFKTPILRFAMVLLIMNAVCIFPVFAADSFSSANPVFAPKTCSAGTSNAQIITTQIDSAPLLEVAQKNEKFAGLEKNLTDNGYKRDEIVAYMITRDNNQWNMLHIHYTSDSDTMNLWFSQNPDTGEVVIVEGVFWSCSLCIAGIITYVPACTGACVSAPEVLLTALGCLYCVTLGPVNLLCQCLDCGCESGDQYWCDQKAATTACRW